MKNIKIALLTVAAVSWVGLSSLFAGTVNWQAATDNGLADANGIKLPAGSLLLVGTFDISDTVIQANFGNLAFLASHFSQFGSSSIGNNVGGLPGFFTQSSTGSFNNTTPFPVADESIYIWVFNAATMSGATQHGIFGHTVDVDWEFPNDADVITTVTIDLTDLTNSAGTSLVAGANIVVGGFQQGPGNVLDFNLAVIPEPSSIALAIFGGGALVLFGRRRFKSRA